MLTDTQKQSIRDLWLAGESLKQITYWIVRYHYGKMTKHEIDQMVIEAMELYISLSASLLERELGIKPS